eukprot:Skav229506  [mRNA]  locus=scaffold2455:231724:233290:+ [translate_table: standard]
MRQSQALWALRLGLVNGFAILLLCFSLVHFKDCNGSSIGQLIGFFLQGNKQGIVTILFGERISCRALQGQGDL